VKSKLSDMEKQLNSVASQVADIYQDTNMLQATVIELQRSMMRVQSEMKELRINTAAGFTDRNLTWPIPQLSQKCCGKVLRIFSPPFYTKVDGYKMCLCAYLDGNGPGYKTHFSIFFIIMRGEYDALLNWPFDYKVTITLINQDNEADSITHSYHATNTEHFQKPISSMNTGTGFPKFTNLSVLRDPRYVKEDTIFIKANVERSILV